MPDAADALPAPEPGRPARSWRAQGTPPSSRRLGRRFIATALVVGLVGLLAYLYLDPLGRPRAALVVAGPAADGPGARPPFADRDLESLASASAPLLAVGPEGMTGSEPASEVFSRLAAAGPGCEILLLYVRAYAAAEDGRAVLFWNPISGNAEPERYPVRDLIAALSKHRASTKVLILDVADPGPDRRAGRLRSDFAEELDAECSAGPQGVWVLVSHSAGERPQVSPALMRSTFGYWLERGVSGAADADHDGFVGLRELHAFAATRVSDWARGTTGGRESQTPRLLPCGQGKGALGDIPLLPAAKSRFPNEATALAQAVVDAEAARTKRVSNSNPASDDPEPAATAEPAGPGDVIVPQVPLAGGTGAATAGGTGSSPVKAAAPVTNSPSAPVSPAELVAEGWRLRDDLERGATVRPDPRIESPHLWRAYVARLSQLGATVESGTPEGDADLSRNLRLLVPPLRVWAEGGVADSEAAEPVRSLIAVRPAEPDWQPLSFGMAEARARSTGSPPPAEVTALASEFDRIVSAGTTEELRKWLSERTAGDERFTEIRLARRLISAGVSDRETLRLALNTRRDAERVAALPEVAEWLTSRIEKADALRGAAERWLLDGIGANREALASASLGAAAGRYAAVAKDAADVRAAQDLRNALYDAAPSLVAWHYASGGLQGPRTPSSSKIKTLLDATRRLAAALDRPAAEKIDEVRAASTNAASLLAQVEAGLDDDYLRAVLTVKPDPPDDYLRVRALLSTPLPKANARDALTAAFRRADQSLGTAAVSVRPSDVPPRPLPEPADRALGAVEIEQRLAALAAVATPPASFEALKEAYDRVVRAAESPAAFTESLRRYESTLGRFWRRSMPEMAGPAGGAYGAVGVGRLRDADRVLRLLDPRDALAVDSDASARLRRTLQAAALVWHAERIDSEGRRSPAAEAASLAERAESYREAAAAIAGEEFGVERPVTTAVLGPSSVSLESEEVLPVRVTVTNRSSEARDYWVLIDHDPEVISLGEATEMLIPAFRLRRQKSDLDVDAAPDPDSLDRPDRSGGEAPSFRLLPQTERTIGFLLRRESGAGGPTRLVLHAIARPSANAPSGEQIEVARYDLSVDVPGLPPAVLAVKGPPGTVGGRPGKPVLHPFPNRVTPYVLSLSGRPGPPAVVDVSLHTLKSAGERDFEAARLSDPLGLDPNVADALVARFAASGPLFSKSELALPADGSPVPLPFPEPPPMPGAASPGDGGLLLVVTDRATGRRTLQAVPVLPQHPRRYLEPRVSFDGDARRVEIRVKPRDVTLLPPDDVRVVCEIVETLPPEAPRRLEGVIGSSGDPIKLFAEVGDSRLAELTLRLSVDGYPRAFRYRVPLAGTLVDVSEESGAGELRITAPGPGASFRGPLASIPVGMEVDAPLGTLWEGDVLVELGLDQDRDRELEGEPSLQLRSDRQVTAAVAAVSPGGGVTIETRVKDFRIDVPCDGIDRRRVNLIARLKTGGAEIWSAPVEVVIDAGPPTVGRIRLSPRRVLAGAPLEVSAEASDGDLSGVARLLFGVDVDRTGEFAPDVPPVAAAKAGGRWVAKVDTAKLLPGPYYVLARAVDAVGNAGEYARERFEVVTEAQVAAEKAAAVNRVSGFVAYRGRPMSGFQVTLEAAPAAIASATPPAAPPRPPVAKPIPPVRTDDRGMFEIEGVPPGKYRISAEGVYANRKRVGAADLDVPPTPAEVPPVELAVDPR